MKHLLFFAFLLSCVFANAQNKPTPASEQTQTIILTGATAHIGNGNVVENAVIVLEKGKITSIGTDMPKNLDKKAIVQDLKNKHIYPGFIACNTLLGLRDIDAIRATNDYAETTTPSGFNTNARALIAYNADSRITPTVRSQGILIAQSTPIGGTISGKSSVMELDSWNWDDAVLRADDGMHLNWASAYQRSGWWAEPGATSKNENYDKQAQALAQFFLEAKAYCDQKNPQHNARFEAMRGIFTGKENLYIHVEELKGIIDGVNFAKKYCKKIVIVGGEQAYKIPEFILENNLSIILPETNRLPENADDDIDLPYKMPAILAEKNIPFTFSIDGAWEQRDYIFQAGQAIGFGLPYEKAVEAGTLGAAKILGIAERVGSLEIGKDATLIVTTGDVFDPRTGTVEQAFIRGKAVDLNNHQKTLYKRYKGRYDKS